MPDNLKTYLFLPSLMVILVIPVVLFAASQENHQEENKEVENIKKGDTVYIVRDGEPLRKGPSEFNPVKEKLEKGTKGTVKKQLDRWIMLELPSGTVGWTLSTGVTLNKPKTKKKPDSKKTPEENGTDEFLQNWEKYREKNEVKLSEKDRTAQETAGAKGLNPDDQSNYQNVDGNFVDLEWMLTFNQFIRQQRNDEFEDFRKKGGLR